MTTLGWGMEKKGARILRRDRLGIGRRKEEQTDQESGRMNMLRR